MAHLRIQEPDQPERQVLLATDPLTIGRDDGPGSTFIAEIKASRRHVTLTPRDDGFLLEDLGSSNGTWVGEQRIQRKRLYEGDAFRIGDTQLSIVPGASPTAAPLVTGTLDFVRVDGQLRRPRVAAEPAEVAAAQERPARPARHMRRDPRKALNRALIGLGVAAVAFAGVEFALKPSVHAERERAQAHREALTVLAAAHSGADALRREVDEFRDSYPDAPELAMLERHLEHTQTRDDAIAHVRGRLQTIAGRVGEMPVSELHVELLSLKATLPQVDVVQREFSELMAALERRREERAAEHLQEVATRVEEALKAKALPRAMHTLDAYAKANPFPSQAERDRLTALRERAQTMVTAFVADITKRAEATTARLARAKILAEGARALQGLPNAGPLRQRLKLWLRRAPVQGGRSTESGPAGSPTTPTIDPAILSAAKEAEAMWQGRQWTLAEAAFETLLADPPTPILRREWETRRTECARMLALVEALRVRIPEKGLRRKLSMGSRTVVDAKPVGVVWRKGSAEPELVRWGKMPDSDVLVLLRPSKPTPALRLAMGVLAGTVGDRAAFVDAMGPLYEGDTPQKLRAEADLVVARHLYGRDDVPEGGYRTHKGAILDRAGHETALREERLAAFRGNIQDTLEALAKESAFKKLGKLAALRDQIDKKRKVALQAIFNEKHYPYPYGNRGSPPYRYVAAVVAQRVAQVRELWESPLTVRVKRKGRLGKRLEQLQADLAALKRMNAPDLPAWESKASRYLIYATGEPFTIQTYFRDERERDLFRYNEWVRTQYNPARTEYAKPEERLQVQITNGYRRMMAYSAVVRPGDAEYQAIDEESCESILNTGKVLKMTPLRAVRIDNRLVHAARAHSIDMTRRGYFSHYSKPNPATGQGSTAPQDRMKAANYRGWSCSENIAINPTAEGAHRGWCSSSGHHRNILSPWQDLGVGREGRRWTQNFGSGGGAAPKIYDTTAIQPPMRRRDHR